MNVEKEKERFVVSCRRTESRFSASILFGTERHLPRICRLTEKQAPVATIRRALAGASSFALALVCILTSAVFLSAAAQTRHPAGEKVFRSACIACHGGNGKGTPTEIAGFQRPDTFPDFTQCNQTTAEPDSAWKAIIVNGGPYRGFSQIMPAFGQALSSREIDEVIAYMREWCTNPHWPRGELNLPRAFATEKAYPENEVVLTTAINANGAPGLENHIIHEQRFGVKNQIEIDMPVLAQDQQHTWYGGIGDTVFGLKREIFSSLRTGSIFSLQGEVALPTGSRTRGFGSGTTTFGMFGSFGQLFRTNTFLQFQGGADLPVHTEIAPQSVYWHTAVGQMFAADHGLGRLWSPMVEFLADRDLEDSAKTNWDVLPEMQVTISRRQHIRADLGLRIPVSNKQDRQKQVVFYLLWDWGDGKLTEGW